MALIKKVQHEEKESIAVRIEVGLLRRTDSYATYLEADRAYVISEALKAALKEADAKDEEWGAFCGRNGAKNAKGT